LDWGLFEGFGFLPLRDRHLALSFFNLAPFKGGFNEYITTGLMYSVFVFSPGGAFGFSPLLSLFNAGQKNETYPVHSRAQHRALFYNLASRAVPRQEYITVG
jgi:hypothetical protein